MNTYETLKRNAKVAIDEVQARNIQPTFAKPISNYYLRDWPDEEIVRVSSEEPKRRPGSLYVAPREFLQLGSMLRKLGALGCGPNSTSGAVLAHELEHTDNALDQGAEGTLVGVQLALKEDKTHGQVVGISHAFARVYGYSLPKLAVAAWVVAPVSHNGPSAGDIQLTIDMGYEGGPSEVRQRIQAWNDDPPRGHKPIAPSCRVRVIA